MKKVYTIDDLILPHLNLPDPCPIKIEIRNDSIVLYVGSRDWEWDLEEGSLMGCGTLLVGERDNVSKT